MHFLVNDKFFSNMNLISYSYILLLWIFTWILEQVVVSLGSGPWDQLFGGGNSPAFAVAAVAALASGLVAILAIPRSIPQKPRSFTWGILLYPLFTQLFCHTENTASIGSQEFVNICCHLQDIDQYSQLLEVFVLEIFRFPFFQFRYSNNRKSWQRLYESWAEYPCEVLSFSKFYVWATTIYLNEDILLVDACEILMSESSESGIWHQFTMGGVRHYRL